MDRLSVIAHVHATFEIEIPYGTTIRIMTSTRTQQLEDNIALRAYCQRMIKHVQNQQRDHPGSREAQSDQKMPPKPPETSVDRPVPRQFIGTLRLKSFSEEMKRAAEKEFHEPSHCRACQGKQADLALDTFIRRKRSQLQSQTLEEKIQSHLYNKDSICLLGEILRDIPKPSDDPCKIWEALMAKKDANLNK